MANVDVKNQSSDQRGETSLQRRHELPEFFLDNPFTLMRRMSEEMDRTFGQFFGQKRGGSGGWYPEVEITERDGQLHIQTDLPGLRPEDVKVEITGDALTISGERKSEQEHRIGKAYRSERRYGQFYREIALPEGVNADQAKAQFRDGVLEISVPVPERASNRRQIPIQASESGGTPAKGPGSAESTRQSAAAKASGQ